RGALAIDALAGYARRQSGAEETRAGDIHMRRALLQGRTDDDILDLGRINASALDCVFDRMPDQTRCSRGVECATIRLANRRARGGNDYSFSHMLLPGSVVVRRRQRLGAGYQLVGEFYGPARLPIDVDMHVGTTCCTEFFIGREETKPPSEARPPYPLNTGANPQARRKRNLAEELGTVLDDKPDRIGCSGRQIQGAVFYQRHVQRGVEIFQVGHIIQVAVDVGILPLQYRLLMPGIGAARGGKQALVHCFDFARAARAFSMMRSTCRSPSAGSIDAERSAMRSKLRATSSGVNDVPVKQTPSLSTTARR